MKNMPKRLTPTTSKLVSLVIANRANEAIAIIENGDFDKAIFDDILQFCDFGNNESQCKLPLYMLTLANEIYFENDDFRESIMPIVFRNRDGINVLKNYWESMGFPINSGINFSDYKEYVQYFLECDDDDIEYLLDGTLEELITKGYDVNEVKFCCALLTYDKKEIDRQVSLGTNPNVWISANVYPQDCDSHEGMNGLSTAYDSVSDAQICYGLWAYWESNEGENLPNADWATIRGLLGAAAYEQLIPQLEKLSKN